MKDQIYGVIKKYPTLSLVAINALLIGTFSLSVVVYNEAKEEGVSKMLKVLSLIGI